MLYTAMLNNVINLKSRFNLLKIVLLVVFFSSSSIFSQKINQYKIYKIKIPKEYIKKTKSGNKVFTFIYGSDLHGSIRLPQFVGILNEISSQLGTDYQDNKGLPVIWNGDFGGGTLADELYDNENIFEVLKRYTNSLFSNLGNHDTDTKKNTQKYGLNSVTNLMQKVKDGIAPMFISANVKYKGQFINPNYQLVDLNISNKHIIFIPLLEPKTTTGEAKKLLKVEDPLKAIDKIIASIRKQGYNETNSRIVILYHGSSSIQENLLIKISILYKDIVIAMLGGHEHEYKRVKIPGSKIAPLSFIASQDALYKMKIKIAQNGSISLNTTGDITQCCETKIIRPDIRVKEYLEGKGRDKDGNIIKMPKEIDFFKERNMELFLPIGYTRKDLPYTRQEVRRPFKDNGEFSNPAIDITLDAILNTGGLDVYNSNSEKIIPDFAMIQSTSVRYGFSKNQYLYMNDIVSLTPFTNTLWIIEIKGKNLDAFVNELINFKPSVRRYYFKGFKYDVDNDRSIKTKDIEPDKIYKIIVTEFEAKYNEALIKNTFIHNMYESIYKVNPKQGPNNPTGEFFVFQYIYNYVKLFRNLAQTRDNSGQITGCAFTEKYTSYLPFIDVFKKANGIYTNEEILNISLNKLTSTDIKERRKAINLLDILNNNYKAPIYSCENMILNVALAI